MRHTRIAWLWIGSLTWSSAASATLIVFDPDDFAPPPFHGADPINNAVAGVTLSIVPNTGQPRSTGANLEVEPFRGSNPSTGEWVFGRQIGDLVPNESWFVSSFSNVDSIFRADFDIPTDFVSIDFLYIGGANNGALRAFDASGILLQTAVISFDDVATASISRATADIAYILAAPNLPPAFPSPTVGLDNMRFNLVPEPSAALLVACGLACMRWARKRV